MVGNGNAPKTRKLVQPKKGNNNQKKKKKKAEKCSSNAEKPFEQGEEECSSGDEGDNIDPRILQLIFQKAKDLREAVDQSIMAKASSLQEKFMKEIQTFQSKQQHSYTQEDKKITTRIELPFFQRCLEQSKYDYASTVIESYTRKPREFLSSKLCNLGMFGLQREDLLSLHPTGWLSAGVIGAYASLITEISKSLSQDKIPSVHIVNQSFYSWLEVAYKEMVKSDTKYLAIPWMDPSSAIQFENVVVDDFMGFSPTQKKILIPVNLCDFHWGLVAVDMHAFTIVVLDPKFTSKEVTEKYEEVVKVIKYMFQHLYNACGVTAEDDGEKEWRTESSPGYLPKQSYDYDCGLFILAYLECIARGIPIVFDEDLGRSRLVICSDFLDYILVGS